jgi:uncharacterized membrane protein
VSLNLTGWLYKYYVEPVVFDTGYNPINTVTWAIILGLMLYVILRFFRWIGLEISEKLVLYTIPYILAGASLRVVEDANIVSKPFEYLLITPLIYFLVFSFTLTSLLATKKIGGENFFPYALTGLIWLGLNLAILISEGFKYPIIIPVVFLMGSIVTACIYLAAFRLQRLDFLYLRLNFIIIYVNMLDASSTYIGVDWFGYHEMHVVPTLIINFVGTAAVMFPLKILVILSVLSLIDQSLKEKNLRNLAKLALITLGLAPAFRNTLRLAMGI